MIWKSWVLTIPGYVIKRKERAKSRKAKTYSGDIAVAIRDDLAASVRILDCDSENILWLGFKFKNGTKDSLLGIVYISHIDSTYSKKMHLQTSIKLEKY